MRVWTSGEARSAHVKRMSKYVDGETRMLLVRVSIERDSCGREWIVRIRTVSTRVVFADGRVHGFLAVKDLAREEIRLCHVWLVEPILPTRRIHSIEI